jgi:hypothetical protein
VERKEGKVHKVSEAKGEKRIFYTSEERKG